MTIRRVLLPLMLGSALSIVCAYLTWSLPRGFDWTDEAWAYSLIASDRVSIDEPWGFQHLLHPVFEVFGESVLAFRWLRLVAYILVGVAASSAVHTALRSVDVHLRRDQIFVLYGAAQFGTIVAFSYPPRYVSYNELAAWITQLLAILMILRTVYLRQQRDYRLRIRGLALAIVLGLLLSLLFFAKVTSFVPAAIVLSLVMLGSSANLSESIKQLLVVATSAVGSAVAFVFAGYPARSYLGNLQRVFFDSELQLYLGHPIGEILETYYDSIIRASGWAITVLLAGLLPLVALSGWHRRAGGTGPRGASLASAFAICGALVVAFLMPQESNWTLLGGVLVSVLVLAIVLASAVYAQRNRDDERPRHGKSILWLGVAVVCLPLSSAVGTNNPITGQMVFASTLWITIAMGLLFTYRFMYPTNAGSSSASLRYFSSVFAVLGIVILYAFGVEMAGPQYRVKQYSSQTSETSATYISGLLLEPAEAEWADWVSGKAVALNASGVPTVSINSPGALLVFNNSGFASPWITPFGPVSTVSIGHACIQLGRQPSSFFVIQDGDIEFKSRFQQSIQTQLGQCGIRFPSDFKVVASRPSAISDSTTVIWGLK